MEGKENSHRERDGVNYMRGASDGHADGVVNGVAEMLWQGAE